MKRYFSMLLLIGFCVTTSGFLRAEIPEPLGGQSVRGSKPSVSDLDDQVVYQRAFEAVIWSRPEST
jgi:hypothetical protein